MPIMTLKNISIAFGRNPILDQANLTVEKGDRLCLIGRNGAGKSTLFKIISGVVQADGGDLWKADTLRVSHLEQDVPEDCEDTVYATVAAGLGDLGAILTEYHQLIHTMENQDQSAIHKMASLQQQIEMRDGWSLERIVDAMVDRLALPADKLLRECSGGVRRRVLLAQALVSNPDLLLLDEPTNHMDIAAIGWLEEFLLAFKGALIFITHDRTFLKNLATGIVELDRGQLTNFKGNYDYFLSKKEEMLEAADKANQRFDKNLAEQEVWIRQGVKARRARNMGRVRKLLDMRAQRSQRIGQQGKVRMNISTGESSGKLVCDLRDVDFSYNNHHILKNFSTRILRGDRVGIIGPNGSGKSTLLKIILGQLAPQSGEAILGTRLEVAYFDQQRQQLQLDKTVKQNISDGGDFVNVRGTPRHVIGYLKEFLFPPDRIDTPVRILSGGERNRLLLAKLFTRPANLLVLDEPTNDLDVDTLELLEELISDFDGTLLVVSHDRAFLDNIVTSTIVFEPDGQVQEYVGGYDDYLRQRRPTKQKSGSAKTAMQTPPVAAPDTSRATESARPQKLTYKEKTVLDGLPKKIEALELEIQKLEDQISLTTFYQQPKETIANILSHLQTQRALLASSYERWEQLEKSSQDTL